MEVDILGFVIAIFLGALIGIQREYTQQHYNLKSFAGFRTFILATLFGAILGFLGKDINSIWVILGFVGILIFAISSYVVMFMKYSKISTTTQIVFILSYILGVMCTIGYSELAVIFGILIATFLMFKEKFHGIAKKLKGKDLVAMVKFALITFVVLPFLPNKNYSPLDIPGLGELLGNMGISHNFLAQLDVFNFYYIWLMVIFIAGISLLGYFLVKIIGQKKGHGVLGVIGGIASSTAVALSMANESKKNKKIVFPFVLTTLIAASVMFVKVLFEIAVVNPRLLSMVFLPVGIMVVLGFGMSFMFYRRKDKKKKLKEVEVTQPFALLPALKFGGLFMLILLLSRVMQIMFGSVGVYVTSFLSGIIDADVVVLTMSTAANSGTVNSFVASVAILLAVVSNTLVKVGMGFCFGNKKYAKILLAVFSFILLVGLSILIF